MKLDEKLWKGNKGGKERAEYGKGLLKELSKALTEEFSKGFSVYNLERMRNFYLVFKDKTPIIKNSASLMQKSDNEKPATVMRKSENLFQLSWTHYLKLLRIDNPEERNFYEIEAINNNWSVRELDEKGQILNKPTDAIKDPYVLDFLGLEEDDKYTESDLESAIINKLEQFLTELGKGFLFVGRQQRLSIEDEHFYVDLVFYNRLLHCFVLIDLKIGKLKHQDLGQMQMYVNYYDGFIKTDEENSSIGIVLCKEKNETLVKITLPDNNEQIFASKYQTVLPSKEELKKLIETKE